MPLYSKQLPLLKPGWTPLHVASARVRPQCTRLLLAAGANPNAKDVRGRTPLDVAGSAHYHNMEIDLLHFSTVVELLLNAGGRKGPRTDYVDTPLHTATELESLDIMTKLLDAGYSPAALDEAGDTPLHVCVRLKLEEPLEILANYLPLDFDPMQAVVDVKDKEGHTVLCAAIEAEWVIGVCIALEAGADVALQANDGETPIHAAAILGNVDVLNEILSVAKQKDSIDCANACGETPLYKAIISGHLECVKALINEGASIKVTLPGDVNVLHKACEHGHADILNELCKVDEALTKAMVNAMTARDKRGFGPIHFAAFYNHPKCLEILLSHGADVRLRTTCSPHRESTPLHIAAVLGHPDIARIVLNFDKNTVHEVNGMGWFSLHSAAHNGKTEVIPLLLHAGADLSGYTDGPPKFRRTAIDMIVNNLSKPTEYLEELFDSYISTNKQNLQDVDCEVTVDYSVLRPNNCEIEQMKVVEALLKTGNRYGQKRLLVHPLVESYLYLKWKALLPFFYMIIACYALFVFSLTIFVVSVFFYADSKADRPKWLNVRVWGYIVYISISLLILQELLYMNVKSSRYFLKIETWVKFGSIGLAVVLPGALIVTALSPAEWPRHVATLAVLLAWTELMFLLSRFPNWGYYVLMFAKVAVNVIKILFTFAFLVVGFSLSFMIEFRSQMPFESPWAAFVKTMVMMTSEFDYEALFDEEHTRELTASIVIVRIIFVVFLVLAAIVLMNLMVGVAVNDITDLEILGNIQRLAKQVEFLGTLDILVYNKFYMKVLPRKLNEGVRKKRNVSCKLVLYPGKPRWRYSKILPSTLRDAIFNKATKQRKQNDEEIALQEFKTILNDIHKKVVTDDTKTPEDPKTKSQENMRFTEQKKRYDDVMKYLEDLDEAIIEVKEKINTDETQRENVEKIITRVDQLNLDIEDIKDCLMRLESKLNNL
ncbi:Transient receptor potential channel pyrexia [Eumeta japonica]|uniref:Transient receptor potential channel pyrexia n=1 Tax=Eumeta variegata TaxID=151549 RepID=A0A4C1XRM5_EUMVA|nr:Transient receptor potential channel pyrexia [Eumeta japonica]